MTTKANMKFLKDALYNLEIAEGDLEDFVYFTSSETCSNISSEIHQQVKHLKQLITDLEDS